MYKVKHLPPAVTDIFEIEDYLYEHSPPAADRFTEEIGERIALLAEFPLMYPIYERDPFFRRIVIGDYLLFYNVDEKRKLIIIHRIFHHSRDTDRHMQEYRAQG